MISSAYRAQVDLLLRILPHVATEEALALKGGTAINLFVRDMPRFSVDIDLTYLSFDPREGALRNISDALGRIKGRLSKAIPGIVASMMPQSGGQDAKLACQLQKATIKVEVNTVTRGHLWPARKMQVTQATQDEFGKSALINVVSHAELYGGKICAALDRQHPRDLFDIHQLFAHEGITRDICLGFMGSLVSHPRPIHEIIRPNFQDRRTVFDTQFAGMTIAPFTYGDFEATREKLVREIHARLTHDDRAFLLSFKNGEPDWSLVPLETLQNMPAVQWKLSHIRQLKQNPSKHAEQLDALRQALSA
jgi:predicted nucleotidyltransferase component of viral defense system